MPKLQVSLKTSKKQRPDHISNANIMTFAALSKCEVSLASMIAMANSINSNISLGKDIGIGRETSFIDRK